MIDLTNPAVLGTVAAIVVAAAGYGYHRLTGERVEVDTDFDGETDAVLEEHENPEDHTIEDDFDYASDIAQEIGGDLAQIKGIGGKRAEDLIAVGFTTAEDVYFASDDELTDIDGIGDATVEMIREHIGSVEDDKN